MHDPQLAAMLEAAAALILQPPAPQTLALAADALGEPLDPVRARQDYYDVLCMAHSGRYLPPFAHVMAQGRVRDGNWWNFPPPRYDGGDALLPWYETAGFEPLKLDADPMLRGPHRPLDNIGFMLAYTAGLVAGHAHDPGHAQADAAAAMIGDFMAEHFGTWFDRFCKLLGESGSPYLQVVAAAIQDAIDQTREAFPPALPVDTADAEDNPCGSALERGT